MYAFGDRDLRTPTFPARGSAWGERGSSLVDESGSPPIQRRVVHRETIVNRIVGLKKDIEKVDSRTWFILTGIIVSILIGILSLAMTIATRG